MDLSSNLQDNCLEILRLHVPGFVGAAVAGNKRLKHLERYLVGEAAVTDNAESSA